MPLILEVMCNPDSQVPALTQDENPELLFTFGELGDCHLAPAQFYVRTPRSPHPALPPRLLQSGRQLRAADSTALLDQSLPLRTRQCSSDPRYRQSADLSRPS